MWVDMVYAGVMGVLLVSNVWLLREVDNLKRQLDAYQHEVATLDDRVCQLMYAVEASEDGAEKAPASATPGGRVP